MTTNRERAIDVEADIQDMNEEAAVDAIEAALCEAEKRGRGELTFRATEYLRDSEEAQCEMCGGAGVVDEGGVGVFDGIPGSLDCAECDSTGLGVEARELLT